MTDPAGASVALPGSERRPLEGAVPAGPVGAEERVVVTVVLRPPPSFPTSERLETLGSQPVGERRHLTREELADARGATAEDLAAVQDFAAGHGLEVVEVDRAGRRLVLAGRAATVGAAFQVSLERFQHPEGAYRGHAGPVRLPGELAQVVVAVLGLDDRPQAMPRFRPAAAPLRNYIPPEVGAAYSYPAPSGAGAGTTIAFIELGGGYDTNDLATYFAGLGLPAPPVEAVGVDGGANAPTGNANGPDGEVMLDLEVAGSLANGARLAVYFAPNTDQGFVDAISAAVHDGVRAPVVISISWGGPEESYTASARAAFESVLADAALAGITVCVAAGDGGSSDGVNDGLAHVDYPAASPQVLACGGTRLVTSGAAISSEVVWNDLPGGGATGGGVSAAFPLPSWQARAGVPPSANPGGGSGRGVPDVAGNADPDTGYRILVDGSESVVGGTSAVAPLWSALMAVAAARLGRGLGFVNPLLYGQLPGGAFHDVTQGNNGAYSARTGWDACTGLGSPDAAVLASALS